MKRTILIVSCAAGLCGGCLSDRSNMAAFPASPTKLDSSAAAKSRPPITASQVNDGNARDKMQVLNDELDRDMKTTDTKK